MTDSYLDTTVDDNDDRSLLGPPTQFRVIIAVELVIGACLFLTSSKVAHWVGYTISAWVVALTATWHRHVDRGRSISPDYIPKPSVGRTIAVLLLVGLILAALHAYFIAQSKQFAS